MTPETHWCWTFEARSIQDYLFETGRLADAVGASLLVDQLTGDLPDGHAGSEHRQDLLALVLEAAHANQGLTFSRRAGGSFTAFSSDRDLLVRTRLLWHTALQANAPGLRWSDALASGSTAPEAAKAARQVASAASQFVPPQWPEATPAQKRVPRTGLAATRDSFTGGGERQPVDEATVARRRHRRQSVPVLTNRFLPPGEEPGAWLWPNDLDPKPDQDWKYEEDRPVPFPFVDGNRDVAFIHADGNGLGLMLRRLNDVGAGSYVARYAEFSQAISRATQAAAAAATQAVLLPAAAVRDDCRIVPARPLILGGDDLQIIVRADLAIPFVAAFLQAFELESVAQLDGLRGALNLKQGEGLTAAAGILIAKASYPFASASRWAGELCDQAKKAIKQEALTTGRGMPLSALAFHRATAALADYEGSHTLSDGSKLGYPAYVVLRNEPDPTTALARLEHLQELAQALGSAATPSGSARRLLTDLHSDLGQARERYRRMAEVQDGWSKITNALEKLGIAPGADLPFCPAEPASPNANRSPWQDALLLRDLLGMTQVSKENP